MEATQYTPVHCEVHCVGCGVHVCAVFPSHSAFLRGYLGTHWRLL